MFPKGNKARGSTNHISLYLNFPEVEYIPTRMCPKTSFTIKAMKSTNPSDSRKREAAHTFSADKKSWGFSKFLSLQRVQDPEAGYLENDTLTFHAKVNVEGNNLGTISKRETGFLGIKSFGETSLLTSFLQCLHHIKLFRKAVFQMPTMESDDSRKSLPLALQQLFYNLRYQDISAKTKDLVKALDWDINDTRLQHDVVEMQHTLFEMLGKEDKTRSVVKDCISSLFMGEYSSCKESQKYKQSYMNIPLDIQECSDIYASLERFCHSTRLERDNHDDTTRNGIVDLKQYVLFDSFPTVLFFHLKRCYYHSDRNAIVKVKHPLCFLSLVILDFRLTLITNFMTNWIWIITIMCYCPRTLIEQLRTSTDYIVYWCIEVVMVEEVIWISFDVMRNGLSLTMKL